MSGSAGSHRSGAGCSSRAQARGGWILPLRGWLAAVLLAVWLSVPAWGRTVEQVISRENPSFDNASASFTVGRDGLVYLTSPSSPGFLMRLDRQGGRKFSGEVVYATRNATANAQGIIAVANAHFAHKVTLYNAALGVVGEAKDFLVSDKVGWDAPGHVEAGPSGEFYALDQHRDRIVRLDGAGNVLGEYALAREPAGPMGLVEDFRVDEGRQVFYLRSRQGRVRCVGFDGKTRWTCEVIGAFDVDEQGVLHVLEGQGQTVRKFSRDGQAEGQVKLAMGEAAPTAENPIAGLRVFGGDLLVRRRHATELFQRYDGATGERRGVVQSDHEVLAVSFAAEVWTAGEAMEFEIRHEARGQVSRPKFRVWLRPLGALDWRELLLAEGKVQVPADGAGLYVVKVTPEVRGWQRGEASEYLVQACVEIRRKEAKGSVSVWTAQNRVHFARGEAVAFSVVMKKPEAGEAPILVRLMQGGRALAEGQVQARAGQAIGFVLPAALTEALAPGDYLLVASGADLTSVGQPLTIGPAADEAAFYRVGYGDYRLTYPSATLLSSVDRVAGHVERIRRMGFNLLVDRLGDPTQHGALASGNSDRASLKDLAQRLAGDAVAADASKAEILPPLMQALAAYGAGGIRQMAILLRNDAGLPLGTGFDNRKPAEVLQTLGRISGMLKEYPAFRGWVWASNWWVFNQRGSKAAASSEEKVAYEAALKIALQTGKWDPILEQVAMHRLSLAPEAQDLFNKAYRAVDPRGATASAAPFRNVEAYPPISLGNVDEVDLQAQWEQIAVPYHALFNVDFYKRPGKRAWGHPEVWNDAGTGDQIVPTLLAMAMRGADGVGTSGLPRWWNCPEDARSSFNGTTSVFRAVNELLRQYGPLFAALENDDRVAIVASRRMFLIDEWGAGVMGRHFARVFEAYISCLHAHRPASVVFPEDLKPEGLKRFKAVLVVDQRVEMEQELAAALKAAKEAGALIYFDGTCRPELVQEYQPLGISFDKVEKDPSPAGDDAALVRFRDYARANLPALAQALGPVPPVAKVEGDEILLSGRKSEQGRYVFVVNHTLLNLDPAHLWRTTLYVTSRVPVRAAVELGEAAAVYDCFALAQVTPEQGKVMADLRSLPVRVFAVLPAAIGQVSLRGPGNVAAGGAFFWQVQVQDAAGKPIAARIPVRLRLLGGDASVLEERFLASGAVAAAGMMRIPLNAPGGTMRLEAAELCGGKTSTLSINVTGALPLLPLVAGASGQKGPAVAATQPTSIAGKPAASAVAAPQRAFGPHIRDMVITTDGTLAVMNMMNWDHNLYAVDVSNGHVRWRQGVGDYFAFGPVMVREGLAIQGFDYQAPEGYFLYVLDANGQARRRFALYGLPKRLPHRFVPGLFRDSINGFAAARDGSWVASAGDLGLAVWSREGKLLWSQDWWKQDRHTVSLAALGVDALLVAEGTKASAFHAQSGRQLWKAELGSGGEARVIRVSADAKTAAISTTTDGGRIWVLREGKIQSVLPTAAADFALSADGGALAVVTANQLKFYSSSEGLQWVFAGDDRLCSPRFSADGKRLAVCSELGSLYVLDAGGAVLHERDMGALAVGAWLGEGDLLVGSWMGTLMRLDASYRPRWQTHLNPEPTDMQGRIMAPDLTPTSRVANWGNAEKEPWPLAPNLLAEAKAKISFVPSGDWGGRARFVLRPELLRDGKADAPPSTWLDWSKVGFFAETSPFNYILLDGGEARMKVSAITLVEDAAHPESWLRDATLEYWDETRQQWLGAGALLSNAAVHTHKLSRPVEASRLRIVLPWGLVGNLRLSEIVLHGEMVRGGKP